MDSKARRASHFGLLSFLICLATFLFFVGFSGNTFDDLKLPSQSWWRRTSYGKRADKGDLYLLGVGKADITGYAFREELAGA